MNMITKHTLKVETNNFYYGSKKTDIMLTIGKLKVRCIIEPERLIELISILTSEKQEQITLDVASVESEELPVFNFIVKDKQGHLTNKIQINEENLELPSYMEEFQVSVLA